LILFSFILYIWESLPKGRCLFKSLEGEERGRRERGGRKGLGDDKGQLGNRSEVDSVLLGWGFRDGLHVLGFQGITRWSGRGWSFIPPW
jgi:hypothetical protein